MRAVLQRVTSASVAVDDAVVGAIGKGLVVLLGVEAHDTDADLSYIVEKTRDLRIFPDASGRMNVDVREAGGALLVVSQFTLLADTRKGRRPSWSSAAPPDVARSLYEAAVTMWRADGLEVSTGIFQADMQVALVNDGPVTLLLDSRRVF